MKPLFGLDLIHSVERLLTLPDGTIISWLRIDNDESSRVIAFLHYERNEDGDLVTWVSPGVFAPVSLEQAEIRFPVDVVRYAGHNGYDPYTPAAEMPPAWGLAATLDSGGTWARETALKAAATLASGTTQVRAVTALEVTQVAEHFEEWLNR